MIGVWEIVVMDMLELYVLVCFTTEVAYKRVFFVLVTQSFYCLVTQSVYRHVTQMFLPIVGEDRMRDKPLENLPDEQKEYIRRRQV